MITYYKVIDPAENNEVVADTVYGDKVLDIVTAFATNIAVRDIEGYYDIDIEQPGSLVNGLFVPGVVGEWGYTVQPTRLERGRYTGAPEDCYPDEYVPFGEPITGIVRVEIDEES